MPAIFGLVVSIIESIPIINSWWQQFLSWYFNQQTAATLSKIADAAALSARAQSDEDRYKAAQLWITALKSGRTVG